MINNDTPKVLKTVTNTVNNNVTEKIHTRQKKGRVHQQVASSNDIRTHSEGKEAPDDSITGKQKVIGDLGDGGK